MDARDFYLACQALEREGKIRSGVALWGKKHSTMCSSGPLSRIRAAMRSLLGGM